MSLKLWQYIRKVGWNTLSIDVAYFLYLCLSYNVMRSPFIISIFLSLFLCVSSCKKHIHPVPNIPFDITININLPSYSDLTGVGGYAFVEGGSKGIIVYRRSPNEFVAFDRHSPANEGECPD